MTSRSARIVLPAVAALALLLTGCSAGAASAPTATRTHTVTETATPAPVASSSTPSASSSAPSTGTGSTTAPDPTAPCTTDELSGQVVGQNAGASNVYADLQLTDTGSAACTLQGWPGLSLVGNGNGTQIGKAAALDRSTAHPTVTLTPGTSATAPLHYVVADAFDPTTCKPVTGDGFRVYPPGSTTSIFIAQSGIRGCTAGNEDVFTVGAFHS